MDSLESLDFSSFIIFSDDSDDPWSLLVSFRQLFKLPMVVQCCNVICEWPLTHYIRISRSASQTNISYHGPGLVVETDDDAGPGQSLQQAARLLAPVVPEVGQAPGQ